MEKKKYISPCAVIITYQVQNLLKTGSDLPPGPGPDLAPARDKVF